MTTINAAATLPTGRAFFDLIRFRPAWWLFSLIFWIIFALFIQVQGLLLQAFFDLIAGDAPAGLNIWSICVLLILARIGRMGVAGHIAAFSDMTFRVSASTLLRRNLFTRVFRQPGAKALPNSAGEAVSRFQGDAAEVPDTIAEINRTLSQLVFAAVAIITMLQINVPITLIALVPFFIIGVAAMLAARRVQDYRRATRGAAGRITGFIGETFGAVQAVQVSGSEASVIAHYQKLNDERAHLAVRETLFSEVLQAVSFNSVNLSTGLILLVGGQLIQTGEFTVSNFALFVYYLDILTFGVGTISSAITRYRQAGIAIERMIAVTPNEPVGGLVEHAAIILTPLVAEPHPPSPSPDGEGLGG